ncbi:hypothetical protein M758_7G177500 [Ceratodon purpureus]|nr:hypothetical protein KC19_7G180100 [Ceratodon purpureus]KAG0611933.1 hypothetical protein M758_7G177500 [Ceratodon purpureus]
MILTSRGKEVQFWVHLDNPNPPGSEAMAPPGALVDSASTPGRSPVPLQSQAHAALLRAASSFKEKSPEIYRSLSADGTRIYDSIKSPPEENSSLESTSSGRIQYPNLQESTSTSVSSELRLSKQSCLPDPYMASSSLQLRSSALNPACPPAPPVSPALKSRFSRRIVLSSGPKKSQDHGKSGCNVVPKRIVDTWDRVFFEEINVDVTVYTNDGYELGAHSIVLMSSSPVFKCMLQEQFEMSRHAAINIRGVPFQAARCFLRFLYSSRCEEADMEQFALQLVVLGHAYRIASLKRICTDNYEHGLLNSDNVVDVLQIARLCDEPRLYLLCLRRIVSDFKSVARSDGWRVMKETDPNLEQELVEAVIEADTKRRDRSRKLEEDKVYAQLHDAMEALVHICRDGCRSIGPHDKVLDGRQGDCSYPACKGLESLVRHFAACKLKVSGGCVHCKRMWQLLELHSRMCTLQDQSCKVPLCRHFKERVGQQPSRKEEMRWKMLVRKVKSAKAASGSFSLAAMSARLAQIV